MILKIEMRLYEPVLVRAEEPYDHRQGPQSPQFNVRKTFHMIDHVEDVKYGEHAPINAIPHPLPMPDGSMQEVEMFLDEGGPNVSADGYMLNLIHFAQGGRPRRTVAVAGNAYLCNDAGDTLEVIKTLNN